MVKTKDAAVSQRLVHHEGDRYLLDTVIVVPRNVILRYGVFFFFAHDTGTLIMPMSVLFF